MEGLFAIVLTVGLLLIGLTSGRIVESRHFTSLARREEESRDLLVCNLKRLPFARPVVHAQLVSGQAVISTDYFKSVCASLRRLVGGRIRSYETLLERGRREALMRMKDRARALGAHLVLNVRFETMTIARSQQGQGVTGVEVLAYGTAVRLAD